MKRITKQVKAIADAHINAKVSGQWNPTSIKNADDLREAVTNGHTFPQLLEEIEIRYVSITSLLMSSQLDYLSSSYRQGIYKGFKTLFNQ
jgi:hypothetical protein